MTTLLSAVYDTISCSNAYSGSWQLNVCMCVCVCVCVYACSACMHECLYVHAILNKINK